MRQVASKRGVDIFGTAPVGDVIAEADPADAAKPPGSRLALMMKDIEIDADRVDTGEGVGTFMAALSLPGIPRRCSPRYR